MKLLPISLIAGALTLSGCASTPAPNPWESLEAPPVEAQQPVDLPDWPIPDVRDGVAVYELEQLQALDAYRDAARTNTTIAAENAAQAEQLAQATGALIDAGKGQRVVADLRAEMLEDERRHHFWERVQYWVIIVALGVAAL